MSHDARSQLPQEHRDLVVSLTDVERFGRMSDGPFVRTRWGLGRGAEASF